MRVPRLPAVCLFWLLAPPAWAKDPAQAGRYLDQGLAAYEHGDLEPALDLFNKAAQEDPSFRPAFAARAQAHHALGDAAAMRQDLRQALPMKADDPAGWTLRASALVLDGAPERALEDINLALQKNAGDARALLARGRAWRALGELQKACDDWTSALRGDPKLALAYFDRADAEHRLGDDERAVKDLTQALRNNAKFPLAYSLLGAIFSQRGDYKRALSAYSKAIRFHPRYAYAHIGRAFAQLKTGEKDEAMKDFAEAVRLSPQDYAPYYNRGEALWRLGEKDAALADFRKAAGLDVSDAPAARRMAERLQERGSSDEALSLYSKALESLSRRPSKEQKPAVHDVLLARARLYAARRDAAKALKDLNEILRLFPNSAAAWAERGMLSLRSAEAAKAESDLSRALSIDPRYAPALTARGRLLAAKGLDSEARKDFDAAIAQDPKSAEAYGNRGILDLRSGDGDRALADLGAAAGLAPDDPQWRLQLAAAQTRRRDFLKAVESLDAALGLEPPSPRVLEQRAQAYSMLGDREAALKDLRSALDLDPKSGQLYVALGAMRLRGWDAEQAAKDLGQAQGLKYDSFALRFNLGAAYGLQGRFGKAVREFKRALALEPRSAQAATALCRAQRLDRSTRAAEKSCRKAAELDPKYGLAYVERGLALFFLRDFEGAASDLVEGYRLGARFAGAELARSAAHAALRQYKESDAAYRSALDLDAAIREPQLGFGPRLPSGGKGYYSWIHSLRKELEKSQDDPAAHLVFGDALANGGYIERAVSEYTKAMQADGALAAAYSGRCSAYQLQTKPALDLAEKDCRRAVELAPQDLQARVRLLDLLAVEGDYSKGLEDAAEAIRAIPHSAPLFVRAGNLRYFLKDVLRARENYRLAVEADPESAEGHNGLGLCLFSEGKSREAVGSFSRAIALDPRGARYYRNRAAAFVSLKAFADAASDYKSALAVNTDADADPEYKALIERSLAQSPSAASKPAR